MGKPPKQRAKEQQQRQRDAREVAARKHQRRQRLYATLALVALVGLMMSVLAIAVTANSDESTATTSSTSTLPTIPPTTGPVLPPVDVAAPGPGASITGETPCPAADGSAERTTSFAAAPPTCIDVTGAKRYKAIIHTTEGDITALLNTDTSPQTVNNFVVLSRYHFYDDVPFHAVFPRMMLVTGDATGDPIGSGGPGYTIPSEIPDVGTIYFWGALAMWNPEGAPVSGSQFLIGAGEDVSALPPDYTVFGLVTDGQDPVNAIQRNATADGTPTKDMRITGIDIIEEDAPAG